MTQNYSFRKTFVDTGHGGGLEKHDRQRGFRSNFADPSEPIYTDPSLFER